MSRAFSPQLGCDGHVVGALTLVSNLHACEGRLRIFQGLSKTLRNKVGECVGAICG